MIKKPRKIKVAKNCQFCKGHVEPTFKDVVVLTKYLSERGRILGRDRTGVCAKHQRSLARSVKHARHLALLAYVSEV